MTTGTGSGNLRLDVVDDDSVLSVATTQPLGGTETGNGDFTIGQSYTVDRTPPAVASFVRDGISLSNLDSVNFKISFSEPVTGVDKTDFLVTMSGVTGASVASVSGSGQNYTIIVNTGKKVGSLWLNLIDNDSIVDATANPLGGVGANNTHADMGYAMYRTYQMKFTSIALQDGWILESGEKINWGGSMNASSPVVVLGDDGLNRQYRTVLSFDTKGLPDNATVVSAIIQLVQSKPPVGSNPFSVLFNLWVDVRRGYFKAYNNGFYLSTLKPAAYSFISKTDAT